MSRGENKNRPNTVGRIVIFLFLLFTVPVHLFFLITILASTYVMNQTPPQEVQAVQEYEPLNKDHILQLINEERARNGVAPVVDNALLDQSACAKADDMIARNYWSHNAPDGTTPWDFIHSTGYVYQSASENLGYGYETDENLMNGWIISKSHHENMIRPDWSETGLCFREHVEYQGTQDTNLIVNHFGKPY